MDLLMEFLAAFMRQLQSPTLSFLLGGMVIAALGSRLEIPDAIYRFVVFMLLLRVGIGAGIAIREAELSEVLLPALVASVLGVAIVLIGRLTLAPLSGPRPEDGIATAGLFGVERQPTCLLPTTMMAGFGRCDEIAYSLISSLMLSLATVSSRLSLDVVAHASTSADCLLAAARRR